LVNSSRKLELEAHLIRKSHTKLRFSAVNIGTRLEETPKWWWWCYPTPSERWEREGTPWRLKSRATPQGLDQRSKMDVVPKMACWRGSDSGQSMRRRVRSCRWCPQHCMKNSPFVLSCIGKRTIEGCDRGSEVGTVHSG